MVSSLLAAFVLVSTQPYIQAAATSSKAISCVGQTKVKSMSGEEVTPYEAVFVINDAAKSWHAYSQATGGLVPFCMPAKCSLDYGPSWIIATEGAMKSGIDREAGTFRSANLDRGADLKVTTVNAQCHAIPMPTRPKVKSKF